MFLNDHNSLVTSVSVNQNPTINIVWSYKNYRKKYRDDENKQKNSEVTTIGYG